MGEALTKERSANDPATRDEKVRRTTIMVKSDDRTLDLVKEKSNIRSLVQRMNLEVNRISLDDRETDPQFNDVSSKLGSRKNVATGIDANATRISRPDMSM